MNNYDQVLQIHTTTTSRITGDSSGDDSSSEGSDNRGHSDSSDADSTMDTDHSSDIKNLCNIIRKIFT